MARPTGLLGPLPKGLGPSLANPWQHEDDHYMSLLIRSEAGDEDATAALNAFEDNEAGRNRKYVRRTMMPLQDYVRGKLGGWPE